MVDSNARRKDLLYFIKRCRRFNKCINKEENFNWTALKDILLAVIVGWIAAEWFIPPIMKHWALDMTWGPAIAFMIGYCGIRLLPKAEEIIAARLSK